MNSKFLHTITWLFFDDFIGIKIRNVLKYFWLNMGKHILRRFFYLIIRPWLMCESWFLKCFRFLVKFLIYFIFLNWFRIKLIGSKYGWLYFLYRFWINWYFGEIKFRFYFLTANFSTKRLARWLPIWAVVKRRHAWGFSL